MNIQYENMEFKFLVQKNISLQLDKSIWPEGRVGRESVQARRCLLAGQAA